MRDAWLPRAAFFAVGAAFLFGYGLSLNLAPVEFSRVVGLYIAILFVMWQVVNLVVFHDPPAAAVIVGGVFIVFGGALVTFWK
jgi:small multidrug resistance family-3 protein